MSAFQKRMGTFLVGLYFWVLTIYFGMVLLDILYARLAPGATTAFAKVSDILLQVNLVILLAAVITIAFSKKSKITRDLIIASQLILLFEFLIPAFFTLFGLNSQGLTALGPWLRIIPGVAASILALIGMIKFNQQK